MGYKDLVMSYNSGISNVFFRVSSISSQRRQFFHDSRCSRISLFDLANAHNANIDTYLEVAIQVSRLVRRPDHLS